MAGLLLPGDTASFSTGGYDVWFVKTDDSGNSQWQTVLGDAYFDETGCSVQEMMDGGFIATGSITSHYTSLSDLWVRKLNASGKTNNGTFYFKEHRKIVVILFVPQKMAALLL